MYQVNVADLVASPGVFSTLASNEKYTVTDTYSNLASGNAFIAGAAALVVNGAMTYAQAQTVSGLGPTSIMYDLNDTAVALIAGSVLNGARDVTANTAASLTQAGVLAGRTGASTSNTHYSISGADSTFSGVSSGNAVNFATNITVTGSTGLSKADAQTLINATNSGSTTIAKVVDTVANLAAMTKGSNDTITSIVIDPTQNSGATVAQVTTLKGLSGSVTYALEDTAANLAASAYLDGATASGTHKAILVTGVAKVSESAIIDAAAPNDANTQFDIADTADAILGASTSLLDKDATAKVVVNSATVTAAQATSLRTLDTSDTNITIAASEVATAGVFTISDTAANLLLSANAGAVAASTDVRVSDPSITVATASSIVAVATGDASRPTYNLSDTYSNLFANNSGTLVTDATDVTISNLISASQAANAYSNFGAGAGGGGVGRLVYSVQDSASNVAGATATAISAATSVTVNTAATVAQAGKLSEFSNISGGYTISDTAANIQTALDTVNAANAGDRGTLQKAVSITVTDMATVNQVVGVAATENRGLASLTNITYSIADTGTSLVAGLSGAGSAGVARATTLNLSSGADISVSDATTLTALSNFKGYDHDSNAATVGQYYIGDTASAVLGGNASVIAGATTVTVTGTSSADTIDFSTFGRGVTINGGGGADFIFGTNYADVISGGTGADTIDLGADTAADTVKVAAADAIRATFADVDIDSSVSNGDTFTVTGGKLDTILNFGSNDVLDFTALTLTSEAATGAATSGHYQVIRGNYAAGTNSVFTVNTSGADTLVLWHDGTNANNAVVLVGIDATSLTSHIG